MLHQIGVGALGPVFRTYEPNRDRLVAVKVFRLDVTPEQARALADELARASQVELFHPSIVEPLDAGIEGTVAFRAEEYVAAESLDVAMRHYAPATMDKVLPFITQLASAVDFARGKGVGHGALHPRDVFVTPDEARATGFGVVDALDRQGLRAPVRRPYSPPERIAGRAWGTPADVFSLAVIAFELLTGRRPSGLGQDMGPLSGAMLGSRGDQVRAVLARAMDEDPAKRYGTALEFASALDKAAGAELLATPVAEPVGDGADPAGDVVVAQGSAGDVTKTTDADLAIAPPIMIADPLVPSAAGSLVAPIDVLIPDVAPRPGEGVDDFTLDDFVPDPARQAPADSPREVARKAIAARKRQPKPKPAPLVMDPVPVEAATPAAVDAPIETAPPAVVAPLAADVPDDITIADAEATVAIAQLPPEVPVVLPVVPGIETVETPVETSAVPEPPPQAEVIDHAEDTVAALPASPRLVETVEPDDVAQLADAAIARDGQDRVVAVDEFRARESAAAAARAERSWRTPDRPTQERLVLPKASPVDPVDPDLAPAYEEPQVERPRVVMLPAAVGVILGLLAGTMLGHFLGVRDERARAASEATAAPPTAAATSPSQTPGTSGQTAGKAFSEGAVTPPAVPAPVETRKPVTPNVVTPAPAAPAARTAAAAPAPRSGRIVVHSTPAGAAVTVNGRWSGRTPLTLDGQAFQPYVVRVVQPGFVVARETFTLSATDATRTVTVTLAPTAGAAPKPSAAAPAPTARTTPVAPPPVAAAAKATAGEIYVDSRPQGARVLVDGKEQGVTPLRVTGQSIGSHVVRLELADHAPWTNTTNVTAGETARVTGSLERIR